MTLEGNKWLNISTHPFRVIRGKYCSPFDVFYGHGSPGMYPLRADGVVGYRVSGIFVLECADLCLFTGMVSGWSGLPGGLDT